MNGKNGKNLVDALASSKLFLDYSRSFSDMTGLPITLRAVESWQLPYHGRRNENGYCALMARKSSACASCLQTQQRLSECAAHEPQAITCPSGLSETAVPVRLGDYLVGFLQTGQVFRRKPSPGQFERVAQQVASWGLEVEADVLKHAYFGTQVISNRQHDAIVNMLSIFSQHLSMVSNQVVVRQTQPDPPMVERAKDYIADHQSENLTLSQVARAVNTSTFYFCKVFKKATGINFTDYVSRIRIEKAKNLALNPNLRISEIAFEVGFQSLTHFNRVFKKITGHSPTEYRAQLPIS
ncbi:MAG: helix-turn-helix domain-containing protein [Verrucomicrobiales bacterium]|nr:helix-turn-helix domain-containing protein [Verrucomicrobiales bacterium]MCP5525456.1 helix-turn-helix domain-containing protein [Verrucomicrobiales bacterium]